MATTWDCMIVGAGLAGLRVGIEILKHSPQYKLLDHTPFQRAILTIHKI